MEERQHLHKDIVELIKSIIPLVDNKENIIAHNNRLKALKKYEGFIGIVKGYVADMEREGKLSNCPSDILTVMSSIQLPEFYEN